MRQKISTLVDPSLYRRVKLAAVKRNKQISEIVGEALEEYLQVEDQASARAGVVAESWGVLQLSRDQVREVMEEEALLDA